MSEQRKVSLIKAFYARLEEAWSLMHVCVVLSAWFSASNNPEPAPREGVGVSRVGLFVGV